MPRGLAVTALLPLLTLLAGSTAWAEGESQTLIEVRHDLFGERMAPAMQYVSAWEQLDRIEFEGAAGLEW